MALMRGVNSGNFMEFAKDFIALRDGQTYEVRRFAEKRGGDILPATPEQWWAWRGYRESRHLGVAFMDARGRENKSWTVPSEWPSGFDADWTVADDHEAANRQSRQNIEPPFHRASEAERIIHVAAARKRVASWDWKSKSDVWKPAPPKPETVVEVRERISKPIGLPFPSYLMDKLNDQSL